ncbi:sensor domain-containing diguanylate cyclase [bacterium]|nr:sensor domain-containing diguanylate cyclase [bacterium]
MEHILFIGQESTLRMIKQVSTQAAQSRSIVHTRMLTEKQSKRIEIGYFATVLFEVISPTRLNECNQIQQANPNVPIILITTPAIRSLRVWHSSMVDFFDVLHFPEHQERVPLVLDRACQIHHHYRKMDQYRVKMLDRLDQLSIIIETGRTVTSTLHLDEVVNSIMDMITDLIKAEAWSLLMLDEKSHELYFKDARGLKRKKIKQFRLKMGQGVAGWVAQQKKPLIVNDAQHDERFYRGIDIQTRFVTRSILCAPIIFKGKLLAVIEILNRLDNEPFRKKDLSTISSLLDSAAIALENANLFNQAEELAVTDDLTSLYNARFLNQVLEAEITRAQRYKSQVSFIFMDIDYFKLVNDNFGHMIGREALKEVAELMKSHFRETDLIARYGGDEFVLVLPETGTQETFQLAESMRRKLAEHVFLENTGNKVHLTASFGVATFPIHAKNKDELILMADKAMFQAKGECRNMVYIASREDVSETVD